MAVERSEEITGNERKTKGGEKDRFFRAQIVRRGSQQNYLIVHYELRVSD
jgi:hypothetical protein